MIDNYTYTKNKIWLTLGNHNICLTDVQYFSYIANNIKILFSSGETIKIPLTKKDYNMFIDNFFENNND